MRKNILILGHSYATQFIDIFNQYTRLFDKNRYEVTVAYLTGEPNEAVKKRTLAEQVLFLDIPKKKIRALKIGAIQTLLALCREKQFQIVICHRYKPTYIMMWAAQFCKIPAMIFVMHELKTMSARGRQLLIAALHRKNMVFAGVSNAVRNDMRKDLWCVSNEKVVTLYNMIDVEATEPLLLSRQEARKALQLTDQDFIFGTIGRLAPNKDQESLIRAFAQIKPDCPQAKLIIIGDGELESRLREQVKNNRLDHDVIFTGFLSNAFRYMKAFDCFVLPSTQEAFGRVLLEAMIAKLPIIATHVNGIPEVVGDSGILVQAKAVDELASAMQTIHHLSAHEREQQGKKAYERVIHHFSIPCFHEQFWQLPLVQSIKE